MFADAALSHADRVPHWYVLLARRGLLPLGTLPLLLQQLKLMPR
jgi:hypothetical protein